MMNYKIVSSEEEDAALEMLDTSRAQIKTLHAIRETLSIFSYWKENTDTVIKKGHKRTTLRVIFETSSAVVQYEINQSGGITRMFKIRDNMFP